MNVEGIQPEGFFATRKLSNIFLMLVERVGLYAHT